MFELNFFEFLLILIIALIYLMYNNTCESFSNDSTSQEFIDYMFNDKELYKYVLNENEDLSNFLNKDDNNTISMYIENKDNKLKLYNSINNYITSHPGLTKYISQNGIKMNNLIKKPNRLNKIS